MFEEELCADIRCLRYLIHLLRALSFQRRHLAKIWCTVVSIFNWCLTSKAISQERFSISILRIFQGFAYNRHYDYTSLIWSDLVEVVEAKGSKRNGQKFVPFMQFLQTLIHLFMRENKDVPRQRGEDT